MRLRPLTSRHGLAAAALIATFALAACGSDSDGTGTASGDTAATPTPSATQNQASAPFGPSCPDVPDTGPGSLDALADAPVATAAAQNPQLSTLVTAVTKAGLGDTLNSAEAITVFAPTNEAFAKIPTATLNGVLADQKALTNILTYHVVQERQAPTDLDSGTLTTLQGGTITTAKAGETYTANNARVLCGNLQTQNATIYLIDTVLMPTS